MNITKEIILKYDVAGPRYTSYPTAPEWSPVVTAVTYRQKLKEFGEGSKTLSLYIHIPFCQTMCSFCACSVIIRKQKEEYGDEYLEYLFKEIDFVRQAIGKKAKVRQFHWGGGTPTYLNEAQIEKLFNKVTENFDIDFDGEIAIEIDPRTIDKSKVKKLRELGFNRVSMGVQDFDPTVQKSVNRIQSLEVVKDLYDWCRKLEFKSINFDLIYGLPNQSPKSFSDTVGKVVSLYPDRIALYSFAYLPWLKKHQNKIEVESLPSSDEKLDIFLNSRQELLQNGYQAIAMDHFARREDELAKAFNQGKLYRNFMGYTVKPADEYIGLGVSAIGFLENIFVQNHKVLANYFQALFNGELPIERGKELNEDDQIRQWVINSLMCRFQVDKKEFQNKFYRAFDEYFQEEEEHIVCCQMEGLISMEDGLLQVTELGKIFIRNVCMGFDWYLRQAAGHKKFSKAV